MKRLSEKFDHLPQEFDRMAIWNGIVKPKQKFFPRIYLWGFFFLMMGLSSLLFLRNQSDSPSSRGEKISSSTPDISLNKSELSFPEKDTSLDENQKNDPECEIKNDSFIYPSYSEKSVLFEQINIDINPPSINRVNEKGFGGNNQNRAVISFSYLDKSIKTEINIPDFVLPPTRAKGNNTISENRTEFPDIGRKKNQSLSLYGGIGRHQTNFSTPEGGDMLWRSSLEKSQMDYSSGIRYEYLFGRDFLISLKGGYHLYKDKINTAALLDSMNQEVQIDFRLHNHYHVFSGHAELGKRIFFHEFFWDVMGGIGLKIYQISEVDYFTDEGQLASDAEILEMYTSSSDVFISGQTAIGRQVGDRLFIRIGAQACSRVELSGFQAQNAHRIFPANAFLETGIRF